MDLAQILKLPIKFRDFQIYIEINWQGICRSEMRSCKDREFLLPSIRSRSATSVAKRNRLLPRSKDRAKSAKVSTDSNFIVSKSINALSKLWSSMSVFKTQIHGTKNYAQDKASRQKSFKVCVTKKN